MIKWIKRWISSILALLLAIGAILCALSMVSSNENAILICCHTALSFFSIFQLCRILKDAYDKQIGRAHV